MSTIRKHRKKPLPTPFGISLCLIPGSCNTTATGSAGGDDRADVRATFLQPFLVYGTPEGVSYALNMESTYDREAEKTSAPINLQVNKVGRIGSQMIQFGGGLRYWADSPGRRSRRPGPAVQFRVAVPEIDAYSGSDGVSRRTRRAMRASRCAM
jgi:hypothetical protein